MKYRKRCQWALIPRYPSHIASNAAIFDVVQVEVLQLNPVLEEDSADEPPGGDGKAALVESHKRHHKSFGGRQELVARHPPLHGGGEWRKLACLNKTEELLA
jgi:hypothetical protein